MSRALPVRAMISCNCWDTEWVSQTLRNYLNPGSIFPLRQRSVLARMEVEFLNSKRGFGEMWVIGILSPAPSPNVFLRRGDAILVNFCRA